VPLHVVVQPDVGTGLVVATAFQVEQVRAVSAHRFMERLGRLDFMHLRVIDEILRKALSL
jgi:mRNA-degrading endonuclease toxin of MazEF toxin-antitoxin module